MNSGLGTGMAQSALFVALQASIDPKDRASATSALLLVGPTGSTVGIAVGSALIIAGLRNGLSARLTELGLSADHIQKVDDKPISAAQSQRQGIC
jgi:hypothetical protein